MRDALTSSIVAITRAAVQAASTPEGCRTRVVESPKEQTVRVIFDIFCPDAERERILGAVKAAVPMGITVSVDRHAYRS